jgi:hypothetical protein
MFALGHKRLRFPNGGISGHRKQTGPMSALARKQTSVSAISNLSRCTNQSGRNKIVEEDGLNEISCIVGNRVASTKTTNLAAAPPVYRLASRCRSLLSERGVLSCISA